MLKGLVLAAGFGSRLLPFTEKIPKPLLPFAGPTLLDLAIFKLKQLHIPIAVNTHHLSEKIDLHIQKWWFGENIKISHEDSIRDTGGAVSFLQPWLGDSHLVIINADIVSDIDLKSALEIHFDSNAYATMVLLPNQIPLTTPVYTKGNLIKSINHLSIQADDHPHTFSGIHILSPRFIAELPTTTPNHSIIDTYTKILSNCLPIARFIHHGFWADIGTPERLFNAHRMFIDNYSDSLDRRLGVSEMGIFINESRFFDLTKRSIYCLSQKTEIQVGNHAFVNRDIKTDSRCYIEKSVVVSKCNLDGKISNKILGSECVLPIS